MGNLIKPAAKKDGRKQTPDSGGEKDNEKWKVEKKPRAYEEVDLPNDEDAVDPQAQYKVVKQPRSYEEVTIGDGPDEKPRLSSKPAGGQLNYVEVEFTKDKKKNSKKKKKDKDIKHSAPKPTVEYTEVTVQDSSIYINK